MLYCIQYFFFGGRPNIPLFDIGSEGLVPFGMGGADFFFFTVYLRFYAVTMGHR
jgi:hypothetical protein